MGSVRHHSKKGIPLIRGWVRPAASQTISATGLCVHLHGYDALIEALPPAAAAALLGEFFALLGGAVLELGGRIFHFAQADMLAGFGVGDWRHAGVHEAVLAAQRIQERFAPVRSSCRQQHSIDVAAGIGVNRGEVVIGVFGPPELSVPTIVGDAVHLAVQLSRRARAGEILLSSAVYFAHRGLGAEESAGAAQFRHLPQLQLPGRSAPAEAWCASADQRLEAQRATQPEPLARH